MGYEPPNGEENKEGRGIRLDRATEGKTGLINKSLETCSGHAIVPIPLPLSTMPLYPASCHRHIVPCPLHFKPSILSPALCLLHVALYPCILFPPHCPLPLQPAPSTLTFPYLTSSFRFTPCLSTFYPFHIASRIPHSPHYPMSHEFCPPTLYTLLPLIV